MTAYGELEEFVVTCISAGAKLYRRLMEHHRTLIALDEINAGAERNAIELPAEEHLAQFCQGFVASEKLMALAKLT